MKHLLRIEPLEARIAPATLVNPTTVVFHDLSRGDRAGGAPALQVARFLSFPGCEGYPTGTQAQKRLRSPKTLSMRPMEGQYLWSWSQGAG